MHNSLQHAAWSTQAQIAAKQSGLHLAIFRANVQADGMQALASQPLPPCTAAGAAWQMCNQLSSKILHAT